MNVEVKRLRKNYFEIFVVNNGKKVAYLGNISYLNNCEYFRVNFDMFKFYLNSGANFSSVLKKKLSRLLLLFF